MTDEFNTAKPSLLGLIVSEVEKMDDAAKKDLLAQLRKDNILAAAKNLDAVKGVKKESAMTDEEADRFISQQRKERYEQSKA